MSGHSRWAQIKRQKGTADVKRGVLFTKLANTITLAAREGGGNSETNFKLRLAIERAKQANLPKENIERAIHRGMEKLAGNEINEVLYEGFGPCGVALLIRAMTDNKNRTVGIIRNILAKHGASLGGINSVKWMFEPRGIVVLSLSKNPEAREKFELEVIDHGVEEIQEHGEILTLILPPNRLEKLKQFIDQRHLTIEDVGIEFVSQEKVSADNLSNQEHIESLLGEIEASDEVDAVYTNYEENPNPTDSRH